MKKIAVVSLIILSTLAVGFFFSACGGSGGSGDPVVDDPGNGDTTTPGSAPEVVWTVEEGVKNPVTDLAACAESVMDCVKNGAALEDCIGTEVSVCADAEPTDGCCMEACGDQLAQELASGTSEEDAFLEVFVYDGSCMPGIEEGTN